MHDGFTRGVFHQSHQKADNSYIQNLGCIFFTVPGEKNHELFMGHLAAPGI